MKNEEKFELRREVKRLSIVGYNKKQAIDILESQGFKKQTIGRYWDACVEVSE